MFLLGSRISDLPGRANDDFVDPLAGTNVPGEISQSALESRVVKASDLNQFLFYGALRSSSMPRLLHN